MSDTIAVPQFVRITGDNAPAVENPGWLPDLDAFPELVAARAEYLRLREGWREAARIRSELEGRVVADKERREVALRDAYLNDQAAELEAEDELLVRELAGAKARSQAAASAWLEHVNRCIALVIERRHAWFAEIDEREEAIATELAEIERRAAQLRSERGNFARFEHWAERTGGKVRPGGVNSSGVESPMMHFPYSEIPAPPSGNAAQEEADMQESFRRSYAGGDGTAMPLSDEQAALLDQRHADAREETPERNLELREADEADLVDWLMGCGAFDGHGKPERDHVVAAAEGDPAMAARLIEAERTANGDAARQDVISQLERIAL